jgi:methionyl-tRNA formyltransferase
MSLKIVFMGTPEFSVPTLQALINNKLNVIEVYTQPPKKSKRGQKINSSPVENFCKKNNLNFKNPINLNNEKEFKFFKDLKPDLVIVVAYGQIIPNYFLDIAKFGFINIHASLLPRWRGAAPIQRAIINRDKKIGVSIMKIVEKLDSGPVLVSKEIDLNQNATHGDIEKKLSTLGAELFIKNLKNIINKNIKFINQVHSKASYAKKISKEETKINWNSDANEVLSHIHGLSPNPGAWFMYKKERIKVLKAKIAKENGKFGTVLDSNLTIACKSNAIQILELQRQGKNKQLVKEFLLGNKIFTGSILI